MWKKIVIALVLLLVGAAELALAFAFFWRVPVAYRPFRFDAEEVERVSLYWDVWPEGGPTVTHCTHLSDREDIAEICEYFAGLRLMEAEYTTYYQSVDGIRDGHILNIHMKDGTVRKLTYSKYDLLKIETKGWFSTDEESIFYHCDAYVMDQFLQPLPIR